MWRQSQLLQRPTSLSKRHPINRAAIPRIEAGITSEFGFSAAVSHHYDRFKRSFKRIR